MEQLLSALEGERRSQRTGWALQRAGWVVIAAWLLASATGAIGPGPASRGHFTTPDHQVSIQFDRVFHLGAPARLVVHIEREQAGALSLGLGGAYREAFQVRDVVPGPRAQGAGPDERRFTLEVDAAGSTRVELTLVPVDWGWQTGELRLDGQPVATLRHLVLP